MLTMLNWTYGDLQRQETALKEMVVALRKKLGKLKVYVTQQMMASYKPAQVGAIARVVLLKPRCFSGSKHAGKSTTFSKAGVVV